MVMGEKAFIVYRSPKDEAEREFSGRETRLTLACSRVSGDGNENVWGSKVKGTGTRYSRTLTEVGVEYLE